jgi:putative protein-disulfide isomerase
MTRLHYFFDPLCGWCYGVAPLIAAAAALPDVELQLHGGGLWPRPTTLPPALRQQIRVADTRIGKLSGQPFGADYLTQLLPSDTLVLDSRPTTAAVLAAGSLRDGGALAMLRAIQKAHYERGLHVVQQSTLLLLAAQEGFAPEAFAAALDVQQADAHIAQTQALMRRLGVDGFPSVFVETEGEFRELAPQGFFGNADGFINAIRTSGRKTVH